MSEQKKQNFLQGTALLAMATVIYFPFLKAQDRAFLKEEQENEAEQA